MGFTCGKVLLLYEGPKVVGKDLPAEFSHMHPLVHEPSDDPDLDGVAIGFFFMNAGGKCYVPHCDRVLADGWS